MSGWDISKVAFVDIETTGLDPETDHIWEIAVIVDNIEHCWQQMLPEMHDGEPDWGCVSDWVLDNTQIRDVYNHEKALHPMSSVARFVELVKGRHLVGACPWFDSERLHRVLLQQFDGGPRGLPWHHHLIDIEQLMFATLIFADPTFVPVLPYDISDMCARIGVNSDEFIPKHSALVDTRWAKTVFERIVTRSCFPTL